jgi:phosphoenolpyruvate-protein kinase (PTS system EI component)
MGLYRTEFLYLDREDPPSEAEQLQVYREVIGNMAGRPVVLRTCDLGGDKLPRGSRSPTSLNPALGLRALRLFLSKPELMAPHLRAILRAAASGDVRVMFPLVTTVSELRHAKRAIEQARASLDKDGLEYGDIRVGIMVEVPSAALMAEALAAECDFFSVGTNDLVQYTLALDRSNPNVAHLANPLDPSVLRLLDMIVRAAMGAGTSLSMCGDMAASARAIPIVVGLGYKSLSMPVGSLGLAREILGRITAAEAMDAARDALRCRSAAEVEALVTDRFGVVLGEIWEGQGIEVAPS